MKPLYSPRKLAASGAPATRAASPDTLIEAFGEEIA
jgi:hypothetical protein